MYLRCSFSRALMFCIATGYPVIATLRDSQAYIRSAEPAACVGNVNFSNEVDCICKRVYGRLANVGADVRARKNIWFLSAAPDRNELRRILVSAAARAGRL